MPNFNKVILIGHLTRDPELKYTPKGTAVASLGIAINRTWKTEDGQSREEATFIDADAFGRTAEIINQHLQKGRPVMIEGRLKTDQWEDKQTGGKRSKLKVVVESFQFVDSGGGRQGQAPAPAKPKSDWPDSAPESQLPNDDDVSP